MLKQVICYQTWPKIQNLLSSDHCIWIMMNIMDMFDLLSSPMTVCHASDLLLSWHVFSHLRLKKNHFFLTPVILLPHCNHLACLSSALVVPGKKKGTRKRLILKYQSNALTTTQNTPSTTKHKIKTTEYNRNWIVSLLTTTHNTQQHFGDGLCKCNVRRL